MKNENSNKAITLIALVITIVVLIILAAVAINLSLGNSGIFSRSKEAKEHYSNAQVKEEKQINGYDDDISILASGRSDEIDSIKARLDVIESQLSSLGSVQTASNTIKPTVQTANKVCSITLSEGRYILFGTASDEVQTTNYIDLWFYNATSFQNSIYTNATKRVGLTGYVEVPENQTKTVDLYIWTLVSDSIPCSMMAIKLK